MADMQIPAEMIIGGFVALGSAVAWLAHKWDAGNTRCEERGHSLQVELKELRDWNQTTMLAAMRDNTDALRKLKYEVRELEPSSADDDTDGDIYKTLNGVERKVIERHENGETTAIIRRIK